MREPGASQLAADTKAATLVSVDVESVHMGTCSCCDRTFTLGPSIFLRALTASVAAGSRKCSIDQTGVDIVAQRRLCAIKQYND
jgi:hypothetical protein